MRTNRILPSAAWCLSFLLGQASTLLGVMLALGWLLAFSLALPGAGAWSHGPQATLPIAPPLIGLALGAAALGIAPWSREPIARYAIAGLVFNAIPLALALVLLGLQVARV